MICPICQADQSEPVVGPQRRWRYQRCLACEHRWLAPIPDGKELAEHYNNAYAVPREGYIAGAKIKARELAPVITALAPRPGKMLEVGCSYGALLNAFHDLGWDVDGVEIDARAAQYARENYGINVIGGTLEQAASRLRPPYDIVMMYHVIEHVTDPVAFLRHVRSLLGDKGVLVLKTPNAASTACQLTSGWWEWALAPEHVHLYSPRSLAKLFARTGFATRDTVTRQGDASPTPYQVAQATVKRLIGVNRQGPTAAADNGVAATPALRTRGWYQVVDGIVRVVMIPANLVFTAAARLGVATEAELFVTADAK